MKTFKARDFKQERMNILEEVARLSLGSQVSSLARKGNYVLEKVRGEVDSNMIE